MELGDALTPGWEENSTAYKPCDLARVRAQAEGRRVPVRESVRIMVALAEAFGLSPPPELRYRRH